MTSTHEPSDSDTRQKIVSWEDPLATATLSASLSGREFLERVAKGEAPAAPIARVMGFRLATVSDGEVTFVGSPDESVYNPIGLVHGGFVCTMLDSALGCAVHSTLPQGVGYTSIEIKVNYLRPVRADSGELTAAGRVTKRGRRVSFAEGEVRDRAGNLVASSQSSFLIMPRPA